MHSYQFPSALTTRGTRRVPIGRGRLHPFDREYILIINNDDPAYGLAVSARESESSSRSHLIKSPRERLNRPWPRLTFDLCTRFALRVVTLLHGLERGGGGKKSSLFNLPV